MKFCVSMLKPGDCLLYSPHDFADWIVAFKTWTKISHVEFYAGHCETLASRNGIGVNRYAIRFDNLACVRRPKTDLNWNGLLNYFASVRGQKYDWMALLGFIFARKFGDSDRQICSELVTNVYRAGRFDPINPEIPAELVAPSELYQSSALTTVWEKL